MESLVYNIHNLIHLADDGRNFGSLDKFSCFPFENFLFEVKNILRSPNRPLSQLYRRTSEKATDPNLIAPNHTILSKPHSKGPCSDLIGEQFQQIVFKNCKINIANEKDSYVQLHDKRIVRVVNIIKSNSTEDIYIICKEIVIHGDFYSYPCSSQRQSMYKIGNIIKKLKIYNIKFILHKCFVSPDLKVAMALVHHTF